MNKWAYINLSAIMAAVAFIQPIWFAELLFFFLVPLFFANIKYHSLISYKEGFWWGIVFYSIFFFDLFRSIINKGYGSGRVVAVIFLLLYASSYSALWFGLAQKGTIFVRKFVRHQGEILISWGILTWFYFFWIDTGFFWIFGNFEGNQLNHLVVPLAIRPAWLYFLPFIGKNGFLLFIIIVSIVVTLLFMQYSKKKVFSVVFCSFLLGLGWILTLQKKSIPDLVKNIGCVIPSNHDENPWVAAEHIMFLLDDFQKRYTEVTFIIMPESSFKFPLNSLIRCIQLWNFEKLSLIIGSHRKEGGRLFNTLYYIKNGTILDYYDKSHTLFFTERIPSFWKYISCVSDLFLKDHEPISQQQKAYKKCLSFFGKSIIPYICSEFFFLKDNLQKDGYSLCIVNDSWFDGDYIPLLMSLHAKVIAILFRNSVIYVGYHHCMFIDKNGNHYHLPQLRG